MSLLDINSLYRAAHYLKIRSMKRSIAAFLACRVYISTKDSYRLRISELAVSKEISV
jgi:ribosomal protein S3AE